MTITNIRKCRWCGSVVRMYGSGRHAIYCDKECQSSYLKWRRAYHKKYNGKNIFDDVEEKKQK